MRIEGAALAAVTQPLFAHTKTTAIPASAAVAVEVDLILPPDTAPERVTHRIAYALKAGSELALMFGSLEVDAPEVAIDRQPAIVIKPPLKGNGWLVTSGCCKPNLHRDLRVAIDGVRIETPETFAIDWAKVKNDRIFDGDGSKNEQHYAFGEDVLAVADGTVVSIQDGKPETTPERGDDPQNEGRLRRQSCDPRNRSECLRALRAFAPGQPHGEGRRCREGRGAARQDRQHRPLRRPSPAFRSFTTSPTSSPAGACLSSSTASPWSASVDFDASKGDRVVITPDSRQVRSAYPLYGSIQNYP